MPHNRTTWKAGKSGNPRGRKRGLVDIRHPSRRAEREMKQRKAEDTADVERAKQVALTDVAPQLQARCEQRFMQLLDLAFDVIEANLSDGSQRAAEYVVEELRKLLAPYTGTMTMPAPPINISFVAPVRVDSGVVRDLEGQPAWTPDREPVELDRPAEPEEHVSATNVLPMPWSRLTG